MQGLRPLEFEALRNQVLWDSLLDLKEAYTEKESELLKESASFSPTWQSGPKSRWSECRGQGDEA